ncbi:MAG: hypothetical protein N3H31_01680 [Candidatus Nezhaarchaeota archaeon]|nr:hypothetical protein [Candidatus Nezhaarchaeota archaeon]
MIVFRGEVRKAVVLSPLHGYRPEEQILERRFDPLTGLSTFVAKGRLQYVKRFFNTNRELLEKLAEASRPNCPFCPERVESSTPKFPPELCREGRLRVGRCVAFPSLHAHSDLNAVVVLGPRHLAYPEDLEPSLLTEAFQAGLEVMRLTWSSRRDLLHGALIMNYLPPAGSTIIHPHMQVLMANTPFNLQRQLEAKSYEYLLSTSRNYWRELIESEKKEGGRFIAEGRYLAWLAPYAPSRFFEVWAVFKEPIDPLKLSIEHLEEAANGVPRVLRFYREKEVTCFNLALILPPLGCAQDHFNPQLRMCARLGLSEPFLNDFWALAALLHESEVFEAPEDYAAEVKRFF